MLHTAIKILSVTLIFSHCLIAPLRAQDQKNEGSVTPRVDTNEETTYDAITYDIAIFGLLRTGLERRYRRMSILFQRRSKPVESEAQILRRIKADKEILIKILRSRGYYAAQIKSAIDRDPKQSNHVKITITVKAGKPYRFSKITLLNPDGEPSHLGIQYLGLLQKGTFAVTQTILDAEQYLQHKLKSNGHPFATIKDRDVIVDHETQDASYSLIVDPGPKARFGPIVNQGREVLTQEHMKHIARFKAGTFYDQRLVDDFESALQITGVFSSLAVKPVKGNVDDQGIMTTPVAVSGTPALKRTIMLGGGYGQTKGFLARFGWQHRNLRHEEYSLITNLYLGTREQAAQVQIQRNNFGMRDRRLIATMRFDHRNYRAYTGYVGAAEIQIERETKALWQKRWTYAYGAGIEATRLKDDVSYDGGYKNYYLIQAPLALKLDESDNLMDPIRGYRLSTFVRPILVVHPNIKPMVKLDLEASVYLPAPFGLEDHMVLAGHAHVGSILGAKITDFPINQRYYAGGGGSIRGYGYQLAGGRNAADRPVGGRSIIETSFEARYRISRSFGLVGFVDAGQVNDRILPQLSNLRFGAGIGIRYYTDFAPFRIDIGTPINRRTGESVIGIYFSFGQSF